MFDIYIKSPNQCIPKEINDFKRTISNRPDINSANIEKRIMKAKYLAFYYLESELIGIGAIKTATAGFRKRIIAGQNVKIVDDLPDSEIGWFYISENFRGKGIGNYIMSELLKMVNKSHLFAVTISENKEMRHLLSKFDFTFSGEIKREDENDYLLYFRKNISREIDK